MNTSFYLAVEETSLNTTVDSSETESLRQKLEVEKTLKIQAINKLAEITQRKDPFGGKKGGKVSSQDLRKKEKENRKLQLELQKVILAYLYLFYKLIVLRILYDFVCHNSFYSFTLVVFYCDIGSCSIMCGFYYKE